MSRSIGMVGLGLLGGSLAERFLRAGFRVTGFDTDRRRRLSFESSGGRPAPSARRIAHDCRRVVLSLPTSDVVEEVLGEMGSAFRKGSIVVDTTTGDPDRTARLGLYLRRRGIHYVDATVSGSGTQVRRGEAAVMAGGEESIVKSCRDLFEAFARQWFYLGRWGQGARMKLVTNLVLGLNRAALAEGLAFAQACGLQPAEALRVLQAGAAWSRVMETKGRKMVEGNFEPEARLAQHLKDVELILRTGSRSGARLPLTTLHRRLLEEAAQAGWGEADNCAILKVFKSSRQPDSARM
jgi:3-hydroxyisobutyrate dehydrogenase-like beta-hydroxyacid dehydrogenase